MSKRLREERRTIAPGGGDVGESRKLLGWIEPGELQAFHREVGPEQFCAYCDVDYDDGVETSLAASADRSELAFIEELLADDGVTGSTTWRPRA